jgi:hypothetical protein
MLRRAHWFLVHKVSRRLVLVGLRFFIFRSEVLPNALKREAGLFVLIVLIDGSDHQVVYGPSIKLTQKPFNFENKSIFTATWAGANTGTLHAKLTPIAFWI